MIMGKNQITDHTPPKRFKQEQQMQEKWISSAYQQLMVP